MKRRLKGVAALLLVLCLLLPGRALAAGSTLTVSAVSGRQGESVTVEVCLSSDEICGGSFTLRYDSAALELTGAESRAGGLCLVNPSSAGSVNVAVAGVNPIGDVTLCALTFRILEDTSVDGTPVTVSAPRFYGAEGESILPEITAGTVSRDCVQLRLVSAETTQYQSVRAEVHLDGLAPAGGNFAITYDPAVLEPASVLPLEGLNGALCEYSIEEEGILRVSFAAAQAVDEGALCAAVFRVIGAAGGTSEMELTDVRTYDEQDAPMDTQVSGGVISVLPPSERAPKLWVVGGSVGEDGTATAGILLQGRGSIYGGGLTLRYDPRMTVKAEPAAGCQVYDAGNGELRLSWARDSAYMDETLLTLSIADAVEGELTLSGVQLYDAEGKPVSDVDVRPGRISAAAMLAAAVDEDKTVLETEKDMQTLSLTVDLADVRYYTEEPVPNLTPVLAVYDENGRMVGTSREEAQLLGGIAEIPMSVSTSGEIAEFCVLLLDGGDAVIPLCGALKQEVN